jgi:transposase
MPSPMQPSMPAAVFVALDLSRTSWVVALRTSGDDRVSTHKLRPGDVDRLLDLIERGRVREEQRYGGPVEVRSCYEAGYDGFWLHRRLRAAGVRNVVVEPTSLLVDRRARRVKTDRIDAGTLLRALVADARGDRGVWRLVRVPTPEQEEARRLHRERRRLVRERVAHTNRIRGLLAAQGIFDLHPLRADRRERLGALVTGDGRPLGAASRRDILREIERLELVLAQLAAVEAERDAVAADDATIGKLMALRGIGPEIATVLAREVFYREFANRRQVGGYAGLAPSPFASGDRSRDQGISKAGNALVRTTMVELAWLWVRYQPDSRLARWFVARAQGAAGRIRRIAIVALARKLLVSLWRYLTQGLVPDGAALKAA